MNVNERIERNKIIAWVIACEGSVSLHKVDRNRCGNWQYQPTISVDNTSKVLLNKWKKIVGKIGGFYTHRKYHNTWKDCHHWKLSKLADLKVLLKEIIPYLPIKRKQAKLLLEFVCDRLKGRQLTTNFNGIKTAWKPRYEEIYQEMIRLNSRGKKKYRVKKESLVFTGTTDMGQLTYLREQDEA